MTHYIQQIKNGFKQRPIFYGTLQECAEKLQSLDPSYVVVSQEEHQIPEISEDKVMGFFTELYIALRGTKVADILECFGEILDYWASAREAGEQCEKPIEQLDVIHFDIKDFLHNANDPAEAWKYHRPMLAFLLPYTLEAACSTAMDEILMLIARELAYYYESYEAMMAGAEPKA